MDRQGKKYKVAHTGNHVVVALQNGYKVNYDRAHVYCREGGGYIASIHTSYEEGRIEAQMRALGLELAWIGLRRSGNDWVTSKPYWDDGYPFVFSHWAKNEPNNPTIPGDQNVVIALGYYKVYDGWNDS